MKYIRTTDGRIYKLVIGCFGNEIPIKKNGNVNFTITGKKADTIEELCDEFIYHDKISNIYDIDHTYKNHDMSEGEYSIVEIFGAIWTDKGLIYVAKMNEKGELELL